MTDPHRQSTYDRVSVKVCLDDQWAERALRTDVRAGLTAAPKSLPPKWFYDEAGSELFEKITRLEEYYPTEAEREILVRHAEDIVGLSGADHVVELGAGNSDKTRAVLDAFAKARRLAHISVLDVSGDFLERSAAELASVYVDSQVHAVVGDFEEHLGSIPTDGTRIVLLLGGTIGNMDPDQRRDFLASIADTLRPGDAFLLGTDLVKDIDRLELAYDDPAGITAAFNLNILNVINHELDADFDLDEFEHHSFFDADNQWIDLGLRSLSAQTVTIADLGLTVGFDKSEVMRTEISAKFTPGRIAGELAEAGLELRQLWTDQAGDFAVTLSTR